MNLVPVPPSASASASAGHLTAHAALVGRQICLSATANNKDFSCGKTEKGQKQQKKRHLSKDTHDLDGNAFAETIEVKQRSERQL